MGKKLMRAFLAAMLVFAASPGDAQERTLTILVGAPAGSPADAIARIIAEKMKAAIRMNVVVDNKPGAGGHLAAEALRASVADGATILLAPETVICLYPAPGKEPGFNAFRDFVPLSQAAKSPFVLAVSGNAPAKNAAEFLQWAGANPDKAVFGSPAAGSPPQFFGAALADGAGVKLANKPYEDSAALVADLAAGRLVAAVDTLANVIAQHREGQVRILAVSGTYRSSLLPAVPTFAEQGLKDPDGEGWLAFFAPWPTPKVTMERLSSAIRVALKTPEAREALAKRGWEVTGTHTFELRAIVKANYERWGPAAQASGFTLLEIPFRPVH